MGKLYIVATPIGNLEDITLRALDTIKSADILACEDTRVTSKLLARYEIVNKKMVSYHQHSKLSKIDYLINLLKSGKDIALVTDAGTPGVSDPASAIVSEAIKNNIDVVSIPGSSALTAIISVSALKSNGFVFLGFLPKKKGRFSLLENIKNGLYGDLPIVIYESPYRIIKSMQDFQKIGKFNVIVGREITKKFEQFVRGDISKVIEYFQNNKKKVKGEFVVCLKRQGLE